MDTTLSPGQALFSIFTEPRKVFDAIPRRTMALLPLLLAVAGNVAVWVWYYQTVDFAWLQERLIAQNADLTDPAARDAAKLVLTPASLLTMSIASAVIVMPALLAVLALYFLVAGRTLGQGRSYPQWFGFVAWATAPALLLLPVMALQILLARNGQLAPEALNPLSLNNLVFSVGADSPWRGLLDSINLTTLWSAGLLAYGLRLWTDRPWSTVIPAALLPFAVVYGAWAARIVAGA